MSASSNITFRNFSASVNWRDGVNIAFDTDEATEPVGLDFLVSCGERQNPVTCSADFNKFSISKLFVRDDCLLRSLHDSKFGSTEDGAGELSTSGEYISLDVLNGRPDEVHENENKKHLLFQTSIRLNSIWMNSLQPGAGTIRPDIISSLITGGSDGGGGQTNDSIISSVDLIIPTRSGGSVRDDLEIIIKRIMNY